MTIEFGHTTLELLPEKGLLLPDAKLLVIGDLHFGKTTEFREAGFAIPQSLREENAVQLIRLIRKYAPRKVLFLGDLFHGKLNEEFGFVHALTEYFAHIDFILTPGNHEKLPERIYRDLNLEVVPEYRIGKLVFRHEPSERDEYVLSGHLHPAIHLSGKGHQSVRVPVFAIRGKQMIVPAFGRFTGKYYLDPQEWDHLYAVGDGQIFRLK